jgi:hypothetical protein
MDFTSENEPNQRSANILKFIGISSMLFLAVLAAAYGVGYLHAFIKCTFF